MKRREEWLASQKPKALLSWIEDGNWTTLPADFKKMIMDERLKLDEDTDKTQNETHNQGKI